MISLRSFSYLFMLSVALLSCKQVEKSKASYSLENKLNADRMDEIIKLNLSDVLSKLKVDEKSLALSVPYQLIDTDVDGKNDQLIFLSDFKGKELKNINLQELLTTETLEFPKRTQAEISHKVSGKWEGREYIGGHFENTNHLAVPPEHTDHSWFIRYEGPGWESDKVGYRFYLDWRNATDIFGKKTPNMVLQDVGQDGFDSYHEEADWGMDVLKVGESLGVGSLGMWLNNKAERVAETSNLDVKILDNGNIFSRFRTSYNNWNIDNKKITLLSDISIAAGSRMSHQEITLSENVDNICTGIVKHKNGSLISMSNKRNSGWGYLATYGKQSLNDDNLGMAVLFKNDDLIEVTEDDHSHVLVLKPKFKKLDYFFLAAWELEKDGITSEADFIKYLNESVEALNQPITINN